MTLLRVRPNWGSSSWTREKFTSRPTLSPTELRGQVGRGRRKMKRISRSTQFVALPVWQVGKNFIWKSYNGQQERVPITIGSGILNFITIWGKWSTKVKNPIFFYSFLVHWNMLHIVMEYIAITNAHQNASVGTIWYVPLRTIQKISYLVQIYFKIRYLLNKENLSL